MQLEEHQRKNSGEVFYDNAVMNAVMQYLQIIVLENCEKEVQS